jgi:hypothetical protein
MTDSYITGAFKTLASWTMGDMKKIVVIAITFYLNISSSLQISSKSIFIHTTQSDWQFMAFHYKYLATAEQGFLMALHEGNFEAHPTTAS